MPDVVGAAEQDLEYLAAALDPAVGVAGNFASEPARQLSVSEHVRNTLGSYYSTSAGAAEFRWAPRALLLCLEVAYTLRPGASLASCLSSACRFLIGEGSDELADDIGSGRLPLPSVNTMRRARVQLDLLSILRETFEHELRALEIVDARFAAQRV
jgi:hypothetical protein